MSDKGKNEENMLAAIVTGPDLFSAKRQIKSAIEAKADAIELRLDLLDSIDLEKIKKIQAYWNKPVIFALRRKEHGGKYLQHTRKLYFDLAKLFSLKPQYFDLEHDIDIDFIGKMKKLYSETKIITSYHTFDSNQKKLDNILQLIKNPHADIYKVGILVNNSIEALSVLKFIKNQSGNNVAVVAMGDFGSFVRVVSRMYNNRISYAYVDKKSAPGQISIEELANIYNYKNINADTKIYALIGYPIDQSLGHVYHNSQFIRQNKNAVYVKINLQSHELPVFFSLIKEFPFVGFSVTSPLKEKVIAFLNEDKAQIEAINTIIVSNEKLIGYNTDGIAALDAIERKVKIKDKKILLIGAGGAAKAIAHEAIKRKANLYIFNRDHTKAYELAYKLQCKAYSLDKLKDVMSEGYDVLINATSSSVNDINIIPSEKLFPGVVVMDIVSQPVETAFLKKAQEKNCLIIYGMEMFINQARIQFREVF